MNKMKKLAVAVLAVAGLSGCASTRVAELAGADAAQSPVAEKKVLRAAPSYGRVGSYRMRRFVVVTVES
jgi:hypothetical protein